MFFLHYKYFISVKFIILVLNNFSIQKCVYSIVNTPFAPPPPHANKRIKNLNFSRVSDPHSISTYTYNTYMAPDPCT